MEKLFVKWQSEKLSADCREAGFSQALCVFNVEILSANDEQLVCTCSSGHILTHHQVTSCTNNYLFDKYI